MSPLVTALIIVAALVVLTSVVGVLLKRRAATPQRIDGALSTDVVATSARGDAATLVQFSTEFCAQCPGVRRSLTAIADERTGIAHVEIDLTHQPNLAAQLRILQTPTTFVLDSNGALVARFSGATPRSAVEAELDRVLEDIHV